MQENLPSAKDSSEFQDFFSYLSPADVTPTGQSDTIDASVFEAARLLGITERSVWRRIKAGRLQSKTENGKTVVSVRRCDVRPTSPDVIIDASVLNTDVVLEQEVDSKALADEERKRLQDVIESQAKVIENQALHLKAAGNVIENQSLHLKAAGDVIVYLRSQNEDKDERIIKLLTDSQHKKTSWWHRFCFWTDR